MRKPHWRHQFHSEQSLTNRRTTLKKFPSIAMVALTFLTACGSNGPTHLIDLDEDAQERARVIMRENPCRQLLWIHAPATLGLRGTGGGFSTVGYIESAQHNCTLVPNPEVKFAEVPSRQNIHLRVIIEDEEHMAVARY